MLGVFIALIVGAVIYFFFSSMNYTEKFLTESTLKSNEIINSQDLSKMEENFLFSYKQLCTSKDRITVFEKILSEDNILCQGALWSYNNQETKKEINKPVASFNRSYNDMLMYFNNEYKNFYFILSKKIEFSSEKQGYLSIWLAIREISKQRYTAQFECRYAEFSDEIKELGLDEIAGNYVDKKPMPKKEFTLFVFYLFSNEKFSDFIPYI